MLELLGKENIQCLDKDTLSEDSHWKCIEGPKWASRVCRRGGGSCACCIKVNKEEEEEIEEPEYPEDPEEPRNFRPA